VDNIMKHPVLPTQHVTLSQVSLSGLCPVIR